MSQRISSTCVSRVTRALAAFAACGAVLTATPAAAGPGTEPAAAGLALRLPAVDFLAAPAAAQATGAQDNAAIFEFFRSVELSGIVDAYYTYNFNEPATGSFTPLRNFDVRHNQFSVALVELALAKPASADSRLGFRFDLQYGQVANIFNADPLDGNAMLNAQQAYVSYMIPAGSGLTLDFGKFVTPIGTEPTEAKDNYNYSRAFLYALGPYYHVGARLGYTVNDKFALGGLLVNGWNATGDNNSGKSVGVSATIKPTPRITFIQNFLFGAEQADNADDIRKLSDTNFSVSISDALAAGFNYMYISDRLAGDDVSWQGLALYLRAQLSSVFAVAPRFEIFNDDAGIASGAVQDLREFTLTGELKHSDGLIFRAEYRRDWSNIDFFTKAGAPVDNQNTFTLGFVYSFSSNAP